ncbi:sortase [Candidatus Saccharibacteria bacterium]|nr:MAG: sortase [Candidatus Saccharibacteria bacterium]
MRPDDNRPTTPIVVPPRQSTNGTVDERGANEAAANIVRGQIDALYGGDITHNKQPGENLQLENQDIGVTSTYQRTHDEGQHEIQVSAWQKYHSAWQSYYQQYYERYYVGQVHEAKQSLEAGAKQRSESISTDEAMDDLRSKLRQKLSSRAATVRKSRHFIPTLAAIVVMLVFLFLQYNRVLFASVEAYVTPGNMDPSTLIVDPSTRVAVGVDPRLIVPKINVNVPIVWDAIASDQNSLNNAMNKGVAWFNMQGASARPGQVGNFVVSGHSSNDWLDNGDYKFIFARLEQIGEGDVIYVNYNSTRYTYTVTHTKVVKPTDVAALVEPTTKPLITLITCVPLGTANNRLLVFGEQVSPDPSTAATSTPPSTATSTATKMPSNSPTFLQRIFGIGN